MVSVCLCVCVRICACVCVCGGGGLAAQLPLPQEEPGACDHGPTGTEHADLANAVAKASVKFYYASSSTSGVQGCVPASRSVSPPWGVNSISFGSPRVCPTGRRVVSLTKSRNIPTRKIYCRFFSRRVRCAARNPPHGPSVRGVTRTNPTIITRSRLTRNLVGFTNWSPTGGLLALHFFYTTHVIVPPPLPTHCTAGGHGGAGRGRNGLPQG